jgi:hypothetical protein
MIAEQNRCPLRVLFINKKENVKCTPLGDSLEEIGEPPNKGYLRGCPRVPTSPSLQQARAESE